MKTEQQKQNLMDFIKAHRKSRPLKEKIFWYFMATYLKYKFRLQDWLNDRQRNR